MTGLGVSLSGFGWQDLSVSTKSKTETELTVKICYPDEIQKSEDLNEKIRAVPDMKVFHEKSLYDWNKINETFEEFFPQYSQTRL